MKKAILMLAVTLLAAATAFAHAHPATPAAPAKPDTPALKAMKAGNFQEAITLLPAEIQKDPEDARLPKTYEALKKITQQEKLFATESNPAVLARSGKTLRSFYYKLGQFDKALTVDQKLYEVSPSDATAISLGATYLNLDRNAEAVKAFSSVDDSKSNAFARLCKALAFARTGESAKATALLKSIDPDQIKSTGESLLYIRAAALTGDYATATGRTAKLLESRPEAEHKSIEAYFTNKDFDSIRKDAAFVKALETESKVKAGHCGNCEKGQAAKKEHCGGCEKGQQPQKQHCGKCEEHK